MDMSLFQVESNRKTPCTGSILIANPFLKGVHFGRSVVLITNHNSEEGTMGITLNKPFLFPVTLDQLFPTIEDFPKIPVFLGGPVNRETLFFLHTLPDVKAALPLGNGLYLNGDMDFIKQYIRKGKQTVGILRCFLGCAQWVEGQLMDEIKKDTWLVSTITAEDAVSPFYRDMWKWSMERMGGKYAIWAKYPQYPFMN